jgi:vitamin B12/bleomycin/antimicrobial peptide transport system ATP-binding/permease protein
MTSKRWLSLQPTWLALRQIAPPFWKSEASRGAFAVLGGLVALNLLLVGTTVLFTYWQKAFYNALQARDWVGFLGSLLWWQLSPQDGFTLGFTPVLAIFVLATAYELFLRQALQIAWRNWLTARMTASWLSNRAYLRMVLKDTGTDNPDQRIAEDIRLFVEGAVTLGLGMIKSIATLFSFVFLLWVLSEPLALFGINIHGYLVWVAFLYAALGTGLTHLLGGALIPLHFVQ